MIEAFLFIERFVVMRIDSLIPRFRLATPANLRIDGLYGFTIDTSNVNKFDNAIGIDKPKKVRVIVAIAPLENAPLKKDVHINRFLKILLTSVFIKHFNALKRVPMVTSGLGEVTIWING